MQKILFSILAMFLATYVSAQSEISVVAAAGASSFSGNAATSATVIRTGWLGGPARSYNPYGTRAGVYNSLSINFKLILERHVILGLQAGSEWVRSTAGILQVDGDSNRFAARGKTGLTTSFLTFTPFVGYCQHLKAVRLDYTAGFDLGYCLGARERGKATDTNGNEYQIASDRNRTNADIRLQFQVAAYWRRLGAFAGYALGLTSYFDQNTGGATICKSRITRFGISYRINQADGR